MLSLWNEGISLQREQDMGMARLSTQLVVVSDIHLRTLDDPRGSLLVDTLERLADGVEFVVLNGDIFDFCFGDGDYFREKFRPLGDLLKRTQERGIQVVFIEGNHEFHLDRIGWSGPTIVQGDHHIVRLKTGERIKIGHGDLMLREPAYEIFRATLKSSLVRRVSACVPGSWLDGYALRHASFSRSRDAYRKIDHTRILVAAEQWLSDGAYDHGIFGHFHVPYCERRPNSQGMLVSVESWDRPNLLTYADGSFSRVYLDQPGALFEPSPALSLFSK
jgi:UDP-2,3-diacylglucosamine hydrolase